MSAIEQWAVKDKKRLLLAVMGALAGGARMSFEGDLGGFGLSRIAGFSQQETATLKRSTRWPQQDFLVVPLEPTTIGAVMSAIGGNVPRRILHVQIEKGGNLEFAAYDQLRPGCLMFGRAVSRGLIDTLVAEGIVSRCSSRAESSRDA